MANDELTDDYVASLLAKDAKESSVKYSSVGLEAFGRKPPANKPKPNTRFLRNIIKDTDSHNAALLAKEAAESRARLKSLSSNGLPREKPVGSSEIRRRQLGDIAAILGGKSMKRKRIERNQREGRRVNTSSEDEAEPEEQRRGKRPMDEELEEKPRVKRPRDAERDQEKEEVGRSRSDKSSQRRQRSASEQREKDRDRRRRRSRSPREHRSKDKESRYRQRSPRRKCSQSPETSKYREKSHRHRHSSTDRKAASQDTEKPESKQGYDSDPLDDIIGPRPPPEVKRKGRGTISHASGIDSRFSANYDPTADVQLDFDEENDWDQALEALRDRTKWKQQGADRLRTAGFTEEEVIKWERGGEKREEDVRWSKKGERREWDRGKVVDESGVVSIESKFGRLKDS